MTLIGRQFTMHRFLNRILTKEQISIFWFSIALLSAILFLWVQWDIVDRLWDLILTTNWIETISIVLPGLVTISIFFGKDALDSRDRK